MDSLPTNSTDNEDKGDQIHQLVRILKQIKQVNNHVEDVIKETPPKNKESVEEWVFEIIPLMHNLNSTFCENMNRATETVQATVHLLKTIQDTFQDLHSVTGKKALALYIIYICVYIHIIYSILFIL